VRSVKIGAVKAIFYLKPQINFDVFADRASQYNLGNWTT